MGIVNCRQATQDGEGWKALWEALFLLRMWRKKKGGGGGGTKLFQQN